MAEVRQDDALSRAFQLIEDGQLEEAREIIQSVLADDEDNADAWWIYAHALEDADEARRALNRVGDLEPKYPGLADLMAYYPDEEMAEEQSRPLDLDDDIFADLDDDDEADDEDDFFDDEPEKVEGGNTWFRRLLIVAVILLLVVVGFLVLNSRDTDDADDPPAVAGDAAEPTLPVVFLPPEDDDEPEAAVEAQTVADLSDIFSSQVLAEDVLDVMETNLGVTQIVSVCSDPDESLRDTIQSALVAFSQNLGIIDAETEAIGVRVIDCENDEVWNTIGTPTDVAADFAEGEIDEAEFVGSWTVLGF
ncbi:MAG: tetratricopeptide repeat protein [Anaerolineaceae bacterium]|nr:MAG: tetratricopeptide repeat protein [Anaerolineaceae bacterium]